MTITYTQCVTTEKTWHLIIELEGDKYFFIVQTISVDGIDRVWSIKRGNSWEDCGKRLRTSQKKAVKKLIEETFKKAAI